jgi:signal transduction histidine kinase
MMLLVELTSLFTLALLAVFFFLKWVHEKKQHDAIRSRVELLDIIVSVSLGGYYFWKREDNSEYFSPNLVKMLNLHRGVKTFEHFSDIFADPQAIIRAIEGLKMAEQPKFVLNTRVTLADQEYHMQCIGNLVEDNVGQVMGVIVWFLDISNYMSRLKQVSTENLHIKQQIRNFVSLLNALPFPIWQRDIEQFDVQYYNTMYDQVSDGAHAIKQGQETIPQLYPGMKLAVKDAYKKGRPFLVTRHLVYEGERKLFTISEKPLEHGKSIVGFAYDITRQEEIEQELARHVSAYADVLESSSSAMAVYGRDTRLKFFNHAFLRLGEFDEVWLSSSPSYTEILEAMREKRLLPEQEDFKKFRIQQLRLFENVLETYEEFFYLPDGRTLRVIVIPHALGGLLFAYEDVSDRLEMQRSYNTLIAVQKVTLDHVNEGVAVFGEDGTLKLYNPRYAELWPDELALLVHSPHLNQLLEASKGLYEYGEDWDSYRKNIMADLAVRSPASRRLERKDGRVLNRVSIPLPDGDTLISFVDITDSVLLERSLRERNEALEQADKIKTEFLTNVSYELRTPLTSIMGFTELLLHTVTSKLGKNQAEQLRQIYDSSVHLMLLIDEVLDLASIDAGYMTLDMKECEVINMLEFTEGVFKERAKQNKITVEIECAPNIGLVYADERRMKQVLYNLMNNAVKFTPARGHIILGARRDQGEIHIWVQDTGIGVAKNEQDKMFDRFYRTANAQIAGKAGKGLGLSVVKKIIELHGGEIAVRSEEGKGTLVLCIFPAGNIQRQQQ